MYTEYREVFNSTLQSRIENIYHSPQNAPPLHSTSINIKQGLVKHFLFSLRLLFCAGLIIKDFPVQENTTIKSQDFPGFPAFV